ncbi:MAG: right-handed parallel beta-helix repeat-containing protein [Phycisphaera sp.]|nr:MAG: right-handed parallel beta-helix repeat-containing protein [Phycisphaera sp.]
MTSTIFVRDSATLTIEPGVQVLFVDGTGIEVGEPLVGASPAALIADGTADEPITFAALIPGPDVWLGIGIKDSALDAVATTDGRYVRGCLLRHVHITDAASPIDANESTPFIEHATITGGGPAISIRNPSDDRTAWLLDVDIQDAFGGIEANSTNDVRVIGGRIVNSRLAISSSAHRDDDSRIEISDVEIRDSQVAMDINTTDVTIITDCVFEGMLNGAVDVRGGGGGLLERCVFRNNNLGGTTTNGGGAGIWQASGWRIQDCVFENNHVPGSAAGRGGGLFFGGRDIEIRRCHFINNSSERSGGGAELRLANDAHTCLVEQCTFTGNSAASSSGGGLIAVAATSALETIIIRGCVFEGNTGVLSGGLTVGSRNAQVIDNVFRDNSATESAGALRILERPDTVLVAGNQFLENSTTAAGGAIDLVAVTFGLGLRIESNTFRGNQADIGGAIGNIRDGDVRLVGNSFQDNSARLGGAIHVRSGGEFSMAAEAGVFNRLLGNSADLGSAIYNGSASDIDATGVCWGTDDLVEIAGMIYDNGDDPTKGIVSFNPIAMDCAVPCRVDLDGDGELTIFDFLQFFNLFDDADPIADFDGDGMFTIFDFLAFQNEFDAGCA